MGTNQPDIYFFKTADILLNIVPVALRGEFKTRWDKKYPGLPWDDTNDACVQQLLAKEQRGPKWAQYKRKFKDLKNMSSNRNAWDTQMLCYLLLYSHTTGTDKATDPQTYQYIETLKDERNAIAHARTTNMSKAEFDVIYKDIERSVAGMKYPVTVKNMRAIRNIAALPSTQQIDAIKSYLGLQKDNRQFVLALFVGLLSVTTLVGSMLANRDDESEETRALIENYVKKANKNRILIIALLAVVVIFGYVVLFPATHINNDRAVFSYFPESKLPSYFRGRTEEISDVITTLTATPVRLYNLYGSPAFGKTSTSIAVGKHFRDELGYRVAFVELKGKVAISDIGAQILKALGMERLNEFTYGAFLERLHNGVSEKTLLILDNAEDVLLTSNKDAFKELVGDYILSVNSISIMSTSRVMFNLYGIDTKDRRLDKIPEENCLEILQALNPTIKEVHAIQFAQFTGGIPLLLELIGKQATNESEATKLIQAIKESNVIVASEDTEHIESSKNLYTMIELLFRRISPMLQKEFLALSVFPASFSKANAKGVLEKVFGALYDGSNLADLEHASFLMRYASAPGKRDRLDVHPVLREFAQLVAMREEKRPDGYQAVLEKSELSFHEFFIYILQMMSQQFGSKESKKAMEQYDEESVNIRKVLTQAVNYSELYPSFTNVLFEASDLLLYRVPEYELSRIFKDAADKARNNGAKDLEIALLALEGDRGDVFFYHNKDKYGLTQKLVDMEMDLIEQNYTCGSNADIHMTALSYFVLGRAHALYPSRKDWDKSGRALELADPEKGIQLVKQAIELYEKGKYPRGQAMAHSFLGLLYKNWNRYDDAVASYHQALQIYETMYGDEHLSTAATLYNIGYMYSKQNSMQAQKTAVEYYDRSYKIFSAILKDHRRTANSAHKAGKAMYYQGMYEECLEPLNTAKRIYEKVVSQPHEERALADVIQQIAYAKFELGEYKEALTTSQDSLTIRLKEGVMSHIYHRATGQNHMLIAKCYRALGNSQKAIEYYKQQVIVFRGAWEETKKCHALIPDAEIMLADYYRELGKIPDALKHYKLAEEAYQDVDNPTGAINAANMLAEIQTPAMSKKHGHT